MTCPICKEVTPSIKVVSTPNGLVKGCSGCLRTLVQGSDGIAAYKRKTSYRKFAQDLVQPWEDDYIKVYGVDAAREHGWSDEAIRQHG